LKFGNFSRSIGEGAVVLQYNSAKNIQTSPLLLLGTPVILIIIV
jgi:hypothetical protein